MHSTYLHKTVGKTCSPRRNADEWSPLFSSHVSLLMWIHISDSYESQPRNENKQTPPRATWHTERERERSSRLICASQARSIDRLVKSHPPEKDLRAWQLTLALEKKMVKTFSVQGAGRGRGEIPTRGLCAGGDGHCPGWIAPGSVRMTPIQASTLAKSFRWSRPSFHVIPFATVRRTVEVFRRHCFICLFCVCVCAADFSTGIWDTWA